MVKRVNAVHQRAAIVFSQMQAAASIIERSNSNELTLDGFWNDDKNPYFDLLNRLYSEEYALAQLTENSDLIVHAEGPAARDATPNLRAVNWLCGGIEKQLKHLAMSVLNVAGKDIRKMSSGIDLRLTGFAPGSLYAGFVIAPPEEGMEGMPLPTEDPAYLAVRDAIRSLPKIPQFIGADEISRDIMDEMPDPAMRDAGLTAAFNLSPTGKIGIHTLEIGSPGNGLAALSNRERVVLRETAIKRPMMKERRSGEFVGEMREVDLDANRFHLRNVPNIGTLRCAFSVTSDLARNMIGRGVKVTGEYETDRDGKPRLMIVQHVEPFTMEQTNIDYRE